MESLPSTFREIFGGRTGQFARFFWVRLPQTGQTGWGARVVASERARKEGRGCLGRVKCYRSERVRRSGDSSAAPRERLAGRAVDTRSHQISGKKNKLEVRAWATPSACAGMMKDEKGGGTDLFT